MTRAPPSLEIMVRVSLPETAIVREGSNQEPVRVGLASAACVSLIFEPRLVKQFSMLVSATCGGVTAINGTYFQSSGYPSTYDRCVARTVNTLSTINYYSVGSCQLTVNKCAESVCQLR